MTEPILLDDDPRAANWISIIQREKGRIPPAPAGPTVARAPSAAELAYSPGQKRDSVGRFGSGGGGGGTATVDAPAGGSSGTVDTPSSVDPGKLYDPRNPPPLPPGIDVVEAKRRLIAVAPDLALPSVGATGMMMTGRRIQGLELMHPATRQQLVEGIEMGAAVTDRRLMPNYISVDDEAAWRSAGGGPEGAFASNNSIHIRASSHGTPEVMDRYARQLGNGRYPAGPPTLPGMMTTGKDLPDQKRLPRTAMGEANAAGLSPMHYVAIHELGHVVESRSRDEPLARPMTRDASGYVGGGNGEIKGARTLMPPASRYGVDSPSTVERREPERWAEGYVHYVVGVDTPPARYVAKRLADWPSPWAEKRLKDRL